MIILDASFIIVFFLRYQHQEWTHAQDFTVFDPRLIHDIRLLENQLPFFVIEKLYNFAFLSTQKYPSFSQLAFSFFKEDNTQEMALHPDMKIMHFVDLLRTFFLPLSCRLLMYKFNCTRQLHESIVIMWMCKCEC
jgi:hypothetical protein